MQISAIMNINELAGGRKIRSKTESPEQNAGETGRQNKVRRATAGFDTRDIVSIEISRQTDRAEVENAAQGEDSMNGTFVNIRT